MIKYYYAFGLNFFAIAKMIELEEDIVLMSINEGSPQVDHIDEYDDMQEFFKDAYKDDYIGGDEISEEKYNELKKFLKL